MRKINKMDVARLVLVLALVAGIGLAFGAVGRFVPTHKIVQPVYCGSCHPEQVLELSETTHLGKFSYVINGWTALNVSSTEYPVKGAPTESARGTARMISGGCVMCHNYWENFKWYGVRNFDLQVFDQDNPYTEALGTPTDIYGNRVSPYGLGSTKEYVMNIGIDKNGFTAMPWKKGLDQYEYTKDGIKYSRLDYVWSRLSAVSPGPIGFIRINTSTGKNEGSCAGGTAEHGLCHVAASAVALAYMDQKNEVGEFPNSTEKFGESYKGSYGAYGKGIFFTHEMAFTTAQYAAKPVKICGACHVTKLPPMRWGGEPWAVVDINKASGIDGVGTNYDGSGVAPSSTDGDVNYDPAAYADPFGYRPTYNDLTGQAGTAMSSYENYRESTGDSLTTRSLPVAFRTPDWAHANVPCIRCHAHAGINGDTVSSNSKVN